MKEVNPESIPVVSEEYARSCLQRGEILLIKRRWDDAIRSFEISLELQPESAEAHAALAQALIESGRAVDKGISYVEKAIKLNPFLSKKAYGDLVLAQLQKGQTSAAADTYLSLAQHSFGDGDNAAAIENYHKAFALKPEPEEKAFANYVESVNKLRSSFLKQKQFQQYVQLLEKALSFEFLDKKQNAMWANGIAWTLIDQDLDIPKGIEFAKKSLDFYLDQEPELAMDTLALGYIKQKRYAEAVTLLEQAIQKAGNDEARLTVLNERMQQAKEGLSAK
jgi:tetratricopeptide (TPR) repeat protein